MDPVAIFFLTIGIGGILLTGGALGGYMVAAQGHPWWTGFVIGALFLLPGLAMLRLTVGPIVPPGQLGDEDAPHIDAKTNPNPFNDSVATPSPSDPPPTRPKMS